MDGRRRGHDGGSGVPVQSQNFYSTVLLTCDLHEIAIGIANDEGSSTPGLHGQRLFEAHAT